MAQKRLIPVLEIAGNTSSEATSKCRATLTMPIGPRLRKLWLEGTVTRAGVKPRAGDIFDLTETIKIKIAGKIVREFALNEMDAIFTSYGRIHGATVNKKGSAIPIADSSETTVATAYTFRFPIHFWEDWRPGVGWREGMCWPTVFTNGYRLPSVQVEVPLNSASGVTDKKTTLHDFEAFVEVDDVLGKVDKDGKPIFNITKIERMIQPYAAAAAFPLTTLDRRDVIQQISIFTGYTAARDADGTVSWVSNDPISKVRFAMNDVVLYDDITKTRNDEHNRKFGMNLADPATSVYAAPASWAVNAAGGCGIPLADRFDLIFEDTDNPFDALPAFAAQSMVLTPTMGSAEATRKTFTMLIARYGSGLPY